MKGNRALGIGIAVTISLFVALMIFMLCSDFDFFYFEYEFSILLYAYSIIGLTCFTVGLAGTLLKKTKHRDGYIIALVVGIVTLVATYMLFFLWWW